jgi:hypothetical protein
MQMHAYPNFQHATCFLPQQYDFATVISVAEFLHSEWSQDDNATSVLGYGVEKGM